MRREQIYISTIASDCAEAARNHGFGVEIAEYCTAMNMDEGFPDSDARMQAVLEGIPCRVFHGPFNELFPCAIDPKARALAAKRYRQSLALARHYGCRKVILHAGFVPQIYYPVWFVQESIRFWQTFVPSIPEDMVVCLENVLEPEPELLLDIVRAVNSPKLKLCIDIGHVNAYSKTDVFQWLEACAPEIRHFHIHNNCADHDSHNPLPDGTIPMQTFLRKAARLCPEASFAMEVLMAEGSAAFLEEQIL